MPVLTISKSFLEKHPKQGMLTYFEDKILNGAKIHTLRVSKNNHWENLITKHKTLDIRKWIGKPYKKPGMQQLKQITANDGLGFECVKLDFKSQKATIFNSKKSIDIDLQIIAANDGLSLEDFISWFNGYDATSPLIIIHFTKFRYLS